MEPLIRVAPEVRLEATSSGLRATPVAATDPAHGADGGSAGRVGSGAGPSSSPAPAPAVALDVLAVRSLAAQRRGDVAVLGEVEATLSSMHLQPRPPRRRPEKGPVTPLTPADRRTLRRAAWQAALERVPVWRRRARSEARARADAEAAAFVAASEVANTVVGQHRIAHREDRWTGLDSHHLVTVVTELDADFAAAGGTATCIDAGTGPGDRAYVTVVARYPRPDIVAPHGPGRSSSGRPMLRRRTEGERNEVYLRGLASLALATVRHTVAVAVAADDVTLLVVRPTEDGDGLEPVYLGSLSREAVTLRPALADPVPLLLGSAVRPLRFEGPHHHLLALEPEADVEAVLGACVVAMQDPGVEAASL